jgi:putative 2OG-Fe(II) oxygenase
VLSDYSSTILKGNNTRNICMDLSSHIDKFKQQGFVNLGSSLLSSDAIDKLSELVKNKFETISPSHPDYQCGGMKVVLNLLEHIPYAGVVINNIVSNPMIREFLEEILGKEYKIWSVGVRQACSGDPGLYLHQDGVGQVNLFLSLDDNLKGDGASIFLPSSHLIKTSQKKWGVELPPVLLKFFPFMFERLSGLKGNIGVFSNRTWHGRWKNRSSLDHTVLTIGFFPAGYKYGACMSSELLASYSGTELGRLLARPSDLSGAILSNCECREAGSINFYDGKAFALNIENSEFVSKFKKPPKLIFSIIVLRFFMFFCVIAQRLRKTIRK